MATAPSYTALQVDEQGAAQVTGNLGLALNKGAFSISAWIQYDGYSSNAIILQRAGEVLFRTMDNGFFFQIEGLAPLAWQSKTDLGDDWINVCLTFDQGMARLFVNGEFQQLASVGNGTTTTGNPLLIGTGLQGLLKNVVIYNQALSPSQAMDQQFRGVDTSLIAANFDFTKNPPVDSGPKKLPISLTTGAKSVRVTPCLKLEAGGYAYPMHDEAINPGGHHTDPYTVQAWVFLRRGLPAQVVLANSDLDSDTGMSLQIVQGAAAGDYYLVSKRGSDQSGDSLTSTAKIPLTTWTNVATTFDGTTLKVYVNGVEAGSKPSGPIPTSRDYGQVVIGATFSETVTGGIDTLRGCVSHVDVWNVALTAAQIAQYQSEHPDADVTGLVGNFNLTATPTLNSANGHPVGLAGIAHIYQHVEGSLSAEPRDSRMRAALESSVSDEKLAEWREAVDFNALLANAAETIGQSREADVALFDDEESKAKIHEAYDDIERRLRLGACSEMPLVFTRHEECGRRYLIGHDRDGSFVAYEEDAAVISDCTLWEIQLIFVVIAGALDAIAGLRAQLTSESRVIFKRILRSPAVTALLAKGTKMTAAGIFSLMGAMVISGHFKSLLWAILDVGIWTIIRVIARATLKFLGIGAADVIASLIQTVVTFGVTWAQKPASCSPIPAATLANIKFNHDPTGATVDALSIRQNATQVVDPPEWRHGDTDPKQSPAAYAINQVKGKTVTIQAEFTINTNDATALQIQATGGGILGAIAPVTVNFKNGRSTPQYVTLQLPHHQLDKGGVQAVDAQWTWQFKLGSGAWTQFATSNHRIFTVLEIPTKPWIQSADPRRSQLPWVDALEYSCAWAAGKTTSGDVLKAVTEKVNGAIGLKYDTTQGASVYTGRQAGRPDQVFYLTSFLAMLGGAPGKGKVVNCRDCATIVTTFANLVGVNVQASLMANPARVGFYCNKIQAIGYTVWDYPFGPKKRKFSYHEVAWLGATGYRDAIYDACLKFDSSNDPWNWAGGTTHTPVLPTNYQFTAQPLPTTLPIPTPFTQQTYRERLATNDATGISSCVPFGPLPYTQSGRRAVV